MTRFRTALFALATTTVVVALAACGDTEFISVDRPEDPGRPVGQACTIDGDCTTGRCVGGVCADGGCSNDDDCRADEICVFGECSPADDFACQTDQRPLINVSAARVDFEQVAVGSSSTQSVTVTNDGDCLLTLQVIGLADNGSRDFSCSPCSAEDFPQRIPPRRSIDIDVTYAPTAASEGVSQLLIRSDDATAGEDGLVRVDLAGHFDGIPSLVLDPLELNFGFVPFVAGGGGGGSRTESVTITNRGTGTATLVVQRIFLDRERQFAITRVTQGDQEVLVDAIDPDAPLLVPPFDVDNPLSVVTVDITFTPTTNDDFDDELVVRTDAFGDTGPTPSVHVTGSSLGPPQIEVNPAGPLVYGAAGQAALAVGSVDFKQVFVHNAGQSDLSVTVAIAGGAAAADFTVSPSFVPPIAPGGQFILSVFYNPSEASDPANTFAPTRHVDAALNITSNDTDPATDVLKTIALQGFARSGVQDQVLKVEMEFENADNSWAGSDLRNVDVVLSSSDGAVTCTKPLLTDLNRNGQLEPGEVNDVCADWTSATTYGQASWLSLGAFEEPERIVLRGLGPTGAQGEEFDVEVTYIEDCANLPSGLLANILGISGSVLLGLLGGSIGVPIAVPPQDIGNLIASNCFDHASSDATVRIALDGTVVATPRVHLENKGDRAVVARLRRVNGAFCSLTNGVGGAALPPCP